MTLDGQLEKVTSVCELTTEELQGIHALIAIHIECISVHARLCETKEDAEMVAIVVNSLKALTSLVSKPTD